MACAFGDPGDELEGTFVLVAAVVRRDVNDRHALTPLGVVQHVAGRAHVDLLNHAAVIIESADRDRTAEGVEDLHGARADSLRLRRTAARLLGPAPTC